MGRKEWIIITLLAVTALGIYLWQPQEERHTAPTDTEPLALEHTKSTKATSEAKLALENRLASEQKRLDQLQSSLEDVNYLQSSADAVKKHIQDSTEQTQVIQKRISQLASKNMDINENAQAFQLQERIRRNNILVELENRIIAIDNAILDLQNQARQARSVATSTQDIELQISQLQIQKSQLRSQIQLNSIGADSAYVGGTLQARYERSQLQNERDDLERSLVDIKADIDYWNKQKTNLGDESVRQKRIHDLQLQISNQNKIVIELEKKILNFD